MSLLKAALEMVPMVVWLNINPFQPRKVEYLPLLLSSSFFQAITAVMPWSVDCLIGLVVMASTSGAEDPGFESHLRRDFSRSSHTSDLKIGTPVATLPGAWHYRVSTGTGQASVSIL